MPQLLLGGVRVQKQRVAWSSEGSINRYLVQQGRAASSITALQSMLPNVERRSLKRCYEVMIFGAAFLALSAEPRTVSGSRTPKSKRLADVSFLSGYVPISGETAMKLTRDRRGESREG
jgi:hypothetical protein